MDCETVPAPELGRSLGAISGNLLVRDVLSEVAFPIGVFNMQAHRAKSDFAIVLHADHTFGVYPLLIELRRPTRPRLTPQAATGTVYWVFLRRQLLCADFDGRFTR